ncbi:unnamed protein product, partial [marine sediment metagenome]
AKFLNTKKVTFFFLTVLMLFVLFSTGTRSAWFGFVLSIACLFIFLLILKKRENIKNFLKWVAILIGCGVFLIFVSGKGKEIGSRAKDV